MRKLPLYTVLILAAGPALAGLEHPLYLEAKKAYDDGDCATAVPMLKRYTRIDAAYLDSHGSDAARIKDAIRYCARKAAPSANPTAKPDDLTLHRTETLNAASAEKPDLRSSSMAQRPSAREDARVQEQPGAADRGSLGGRGMDANRIKALEGAKSSLSKEGMLEFKSK